MGQFVIPPAYQGVFWYLNIARWCWITKDGTYRDTIPVSVKYYHNNVYNLGSGTDGTGWDQVYLDPGAITHRTPMPYGHDAFWDDNIPSTNPPIPSTTNHCLIPWLAIQMVNMQTYAVANLVYPDWQPLGSATKMGQGRPATHLSGPDYHF